MKRWSTCGWRQHARAMVARGGRTAGRGEPAAFTLLEVMIAVVIFFMATFAILSLISQNLRIARMLKQTNITASSLAAELSLSNRVEEGMLSGDFGDLYPGYQWSRAITMVSTNGLFQVDFVVIPPRDSGAAESQMSILLYRPESITRR